MNRVYLDHAATTATSPEVLQAMLPYFTGCYGNPSSSHSTGREARRAVQTARKQLAAALGAQPGEIYFTAGGSESDNWAIKGTAFARQEHGNHIITGVTEHHAVLHTCQWLEQHGFSVTYLPVDQEGRIHPQDVEKAITDKTILISIMTANNEIGTIQPISSIGEIAHHHDIVFHTDAVQAFGALPLNVNELNVDMLSLSAHKFHGPKGIGALYVRRGTRLDPLINGGAQERGQRAGTQNLPGIVGLGKAAELAAANLEANNLRITALREKLQNRLLSVIPDIRFNGSMENRLPNNCSITLPGVNGQALLMRLDLAGIAVSSGSACTSGSVEPSHVLTAIGLPEQFVHSSIRISLGTDTTEEDINYVLEVLPSLVHELKK